LAAVGGLALLGVLVLNPDGWGTFLLDVGASALVQAVVALALFFALMIVLRSLRVGLGLAFSFFPTIALIVFSVSAVAALPALHWLFRRPVDVYDIGQTVLLCVAFYLIVRSIERRYRRLSPGLGPRRYPSPMPPVSPRARPRAVHDRGTMSSPSRSPGYQALYQNMLRKVGGDPATVARLIEYERLRKPDASDTELLENAIWRWENDNR
jgi:hypothetical protein